VRLCPACRQPLHAEGWDCRHCGHRPEMRDGIAILAPALAATTEGFDPALFAELARLEADNFWFRARNRLLLWALARYAPECRHFLEIGCGTGYVLQGVAQRFPGWTLCGTEAHAEALPFAAQRVPAATLLQMDARAAPFDSEFDAAGAFDVIEHIREDETVLGELHRSLKPDGLLFLTVPQHPLLWSEYDRRAHHERRYVAAELRQKLIHAGFGIIRMTSFVSLLFPLMMMSRLTHKPRAEYDPLEELRLHPLPNRVFEWTLGVERLLIRAGLSWPFGGSLLAVARRVR
jgi:SAM-dependent methyltransferase